MNNKTKSFEAESASVEMNHELINKPDGPSSLYTPSSRFGRTIGRRSLLKSLGPAGVAVASGMGVVPSLSGAPDRKLTGGDADILRFLAAVELIEADFWGQYNELAIGNAPYAAALTNLDSDMLQYIADNTDDEMSHAAFINAYLVSQGEQAVNLDSFRTLPSSPAKGARQIGRLTNLTALTVDTSWWIKYRSTGSPDFGDTFPQVINIVNRTSIPLQDNYATAEIQAIANTAALHFAAFDQAGSSLYITMLPNTTALDTVRILAGIGGVEMAHFMVWHDKAGNAPAVSVNGLVFADMASFDGDELRQANLIMPEPCKFISTSLPACSVIRPGTAANSGSRGDCERCDGLEYIVRSERSIFLPTKHAGHGSG